MTSENTGKKIKIISILYVDDESILLKAGKIYLERNEDFSVTTCEEAFEALKLMTSENNFDAIISDYQMPEMNGIEFLQNLRGRGDETPFIIFTGKSREDVVIEALNSGADFYLQKGGEPKSQFAELSNKVRYAVSRRRSETELRRKNEELLNSNSQLAAAEEILTQQLDEIFNTQNELSELNEYLNSLISYASTPIIVFDPDLRITRFNHASEELTGILADEALGKDLRIILPDDNIESSIDIIRQAMAGRRMTAEDIPVRHSSGSIKTVIWNSSNIMDKDGITLRSVIAQGEDITKRNQAELELKESEERHRAIIQTTRDGFWSIDASTGRLTDANETYCKMSGYTREELLNSGINDLDFGEDPAETAERVRRIIANGSEIFEARHRRKDGSIFDVEISASYLDSEGGILICFCRDITDRKRTEEALRESEEKFRSYIENAPDGIFIIDKEGRYIDVNPAASDMTGYSHDEMLRMTIPDLSSTEDFSDSVKPFNQLRKEGEVQGELRLRRKDGTGFYASLKAVSLDGERYMGFCSDITERKEAAMELADQRQRLSDIIAGTNVGTWEWNIPTGETIFNERWADIIGYTPDEISPVSIETWIKYLHPDDLKECNHRIEEHLRGETKYYQHECRMRHKNGSWVWVLDHGKVTKWTDDGKPLWMYGTHLDITRRKRAEEELRKSEEKYRDLADNAPVGIIVCNRKGSVIYANDRAHEILGSSGTEINLMKSENIANSELSGLLRGVIEHGTVVSDHETKYLSFGGEELFLRLHIQPILKDGTIDGARIILDDVTDRKRAEEALRITNNKLQLLNSVTRHDILNQVTGLQSFLNLIRNRSSDQTVSEYIEIMDSANCAIQKQIEFTREYNELGAEEPVWLDVTSFAKEEVKGPVPVKVSCRGIEIFADSMIKRVFYNLYDNTLRYGAGATGVRILATFPKGCESDFISGPSSDENSGKLTSGSKKAGCVIVFEDDGCGVPDDMKKKIFNRGIGSNTGLGLFLIREILAITGITIAETGVYGEGARFEIHVPEGGWRSVE